MASKSILQQPISASISVCTNFLWLFFYISSLVNRLYIQSKQIEHYLSKLNFLGSKFISIDVLFQFWMCHTITLNTAITKILLLDLNNEWKYYVRLLNSTYQSKFLFLLVPSLQMLYKQSSTNIKSYAR